MQENILAIIVLSFYRNIYKKNYFLRSWIMRIITGIHKSRKLNTLEGLNTRPMMDRMKESVFNTIGPFFDGDIVLDLFSGSGALSLEALSRGASFAHMVDLSKDAIKVINSNITSLKEESRTKVYNLDYKVALKVMKDLKFDIVFLDPPYRLKLCSEIINHLLENNMLNEKAIIVCQYCNEKHQDTEKYDELDIIKNYSYASSEVCIYQKKK